ncbi:response regulator transcription factor [Bradyrhizobium sp.]|uniref:response regulator transcription factor n=1 Tax=Bradyrhizobium sp. TaxID=376 RepID=UPI002394C9E2|nr:response regulator transcription factor [Bradyrhizobium sp.]MDE2378249.1 response regulator transcription factor [Bradyrhizobium sp.]
MPTQAVSGDPAVIVVDAMELRRAFVVHFLQDWAAANRVDLISLVPEDAHEALRAGIACKMIIFNAGEEVSANSNMLAEIRVLRALAPEAFLVVMADEETSEDIVAVMQSGAEGYLSANSSPDLALRVLSFVLDGGTYFPRSAIACGPFPEESRMKTDPDGLRGVSYAPTGGALSAADASGRLSVDFRMTELSGRQRAILERLCRGEPNKIIGRELNLPESTVKVHVREIMRKLAVSNRTQVVVVASRLGVVGSDDKHAAADDARHGEVSPSLDPSASALPISPALEPGADPAKASIAGNIRLLNRLAPREPVHGKAPGGGQLGSKKA